MIRGFSRKELMAALVYGLPCLVVLLLLGVFWLPALGVALMFSVLCGVVVDGIARRRSGEPKLVAPNRHLRRKAAMWGVPLVAICAAIGAALGSVTRGAVIGVLLLPAAFAALIASDAD